MGRVGHCFATAPQRHPERLVIAHLRGTLLAKDATSVVIDCQGVGYGVEMSQASLAATDVPGSALSVFVHTHVAEDQLRLFGFVEARERATFVVLLSTTGVGPRLALAILSALSVDALSTAVATRDKTAFTRIAGVGSKKAERLIVELQDRLQAATTVAQAPQGSALHDVHSALLNLGFAPQVADDAARAAKQAAGAEADLPTLMRFALRHTAPRANSEPH